MSEQRARILSHACEVFLRDGLDGFSMRKLAKEVGVTAPALYRHFENRERVLLSVVGEAYKVFGQYLYRALSGRSPLERFVLAGEAYLDFVLEHPRLYDMLFIPPAVLGLDDFPEDVASLACATGQFWMDRVRECIDAGILTRGDPEGIARTLWGHAHGLVSLYLNGALDLSEKEFRSFYRISGERILSGLGEPGCMEIAEGKVRPRSEREVGRTRESATGVGPAGDPTPSGAAGV